MDIKEQYELCKLHEAYKSHIFNNNKICECGLTPSKEFFLDLVNGTEYIYNIRKEDIIINMKVYINFGVFTNVELKRNGYSLHYRADPNFFKDNFKDIKEFIYYCKLLDEKWDPPIWRFTNNQYIQKKYSKLINK